MNPLKRKPAKMTKNAIEEKIKSKQYPSIGVASAVVKRADISTRERNRLLELVARAYRFEPDADPAEIPGVDPPFTAKNNWRPEPLSDLDQKLLQIAFQLLGLCIEHKMSREEMYKRLEARLMAGMG